MADRHAFSLSSRVHSREVAVVPPNPQQYGKYGHQQHEADAGPVDPVQNSEKPRHHTKPCRTKPFRHLSVQACLDLGQLFARILGTGLEPFDAKLDTLRSNRERGEGAVGGLVVLSRKEAPRLMGGAP